ncbi:MAG: alpha/beta hydrolase [Thermoleophilaceae bacterium]|nr:alpha/beta hydrolase [Thermoleophilaceae bacterium]
MVRPLLNTFLYFPSRVIARQPADAGFSAHDLHIETDDGERLHGWWIVSSAPSRGHVLLCHGNGGNVGDRVDHARLLSTAGYDVLLFDYRGYGQSSGRPSEDGTYRDARAARRALLRQDGVDESRIVYLGESLGAAVALALALEAPPRGLVLQSAFTSVRDMARLHYPFLPGALVPDAYPSLRRIETLRSPLLVLHGERDDIVPCSHGRALLDAAPDPKQIRIFPGLGHNDLVPLAGAAWSEAIASWWDGLESAEQR